jgi:Putative Ig domain
MSFTFENNFGGGTDGTAITVGNSGGASGDAFTEVVCTGPAIPPKFSSIHVAHAHVDDLSMKIDPNGGAGYDCVKWSNLNTTQVWFRAYLWFDSFPTTTVQLFKCQTTSGDFTASIGIGTDGMIVITKGDNDTVELTGSVPIAVGQWIRVEGYIINQYSSGAGEFKLFNTGNSITPVDTGTSGAFDTIGYANHFFIGVCGNAGDSGAAFWVDDIGVTDVGYLGPFGGSNTVTVTPPGDQVSTVGAAITPLDISASDSDMAETLTYTATGLPSGLSINSSTGAITGTPTLAGAASVVVTATDTTGAFGTTSFSWVTAAPGGAGGGGAQYRQDPDMPVTEGTVYDINVDASGNVSFTGDGRTCTAAAGSPASGTTPGAGGSGGTDVAAQFHRDGGAGAVPPSGDGGGGGSAGGAAGAGNPGSGSTGGAAAAPGGPGGDGGTITDLPATQDGHAGTAGSGGGGAALGADANASGEGGSPLIRMNYQQSRPAPFSNLIVHIPDFDASDLAPFYVPLASSGPAGAGTVLASGDMLTAGESIESPSGLFELTMQTDGNLVTYHPGLRGSIGHGPADWSTYTDGSGSANYLTMETTGDLVLHHSGGATLWDSGTLGHDGAHLELMPDGMLIIFDTSGEPIWSNRRFPGTHVMAPQQGVSDDGAIGFNARWNGTYSVMLAGLKYAHPNTQRTITVTVTQYGFQGAVPVVQTLTCVATPGKWANGVIDLGEMTIPERELPPENEGAYYTVAVDSGDPADLLLDALFLSTMGQTVVIDVNFNDIAGYGVYYIDEATPDRDIGMISGSFRDRKESVGVMKHTWVSGGPLTLQPGCQQIFLYSVNGAPAALASYFPRWFVDEWEI